MMMKKKLMLKMIDQFKITGIGGNSATIVEGNPLVGYGHVAIGYKF